MAASLVYAAASLNFHHVRGLYLHPTNVRSTSARAPTRANVTSGSDVWLLARSACARWFSTERTCATICFAAPHAVAAGVVGMMVAVDEDVDLARAALLQSAQQVGRRVGELTVHHQQAVAAHQPSDRATPLVADSDVAAERREHCWRRRLLRADAFMKIVLW